KLLPYQYGDGANDHAGQGTVARHARPVEREQDHGTESRAKTRPGVADHGEHTTVGIPRQPDRSQGYRQHHGATEPHKLALRGVAAYEYLVDILSQGAGANQQLRRQSAHDRRQYRGQQHAGDPGVEQDNGQFEEDTLGVRIDTVGQVRVRREVGDAEETHGYSSREAQDHP